jgi:hypothetical protein
MTSSPMKRRWRAPQGRTEQAALLLEGPPGPDTRGGLKRFGVGGGERRRVGQVSLKAEKSQSNIAIDRTTRGPEEGRSPSGYERS